MLDGWSRSSPSACAGSSSATGRSQRSTTSTSRSDGDLRRFAGTERRGQVDDHASSDRTVDRGRGRPRGARLPLAGGVEDGARPERRHATARQSRYDADRRAEPARLRPPLPDRPRGPARGHRARARDGDAHRSPRFAGRQALRRNAAAPADRSGAHPPSAARPAREPTVGLDPQVRQGIWALIDALRPRGRRSSCRRTTSRRRNVLPTRC